MKKEERGGTRPAHRALAKNRTSVMTLSKEAWDTGQTVVLPHSLKMEARAERTLCKASGLSMINRSTAGATAEGERDEGTGFFPFSIFVGAMAVERGESSSRIVGGVWSQKKKEGREILGEKIGEYFRGVRKKLRWAFPDYHYMSSIYPIVEKIPILLPVFWVIRGVRILVS